MKYIYLSLLSALIFSPVCAQVGIHNTSPLATLDVGGDVKTDGSLFLENPGNNNQIRGSKFLIRSTTNNLLQYDIVSSKYGPINYAEFKFKDLSTNGLLDYDTKISTIKYYVSVQGYTLGLPGAGRGGSVMPHSTISDMNIEGYSIYAYVNNTTQTWWLRAYVNNSQFQTYNGSSYVNTPIDMHLNIMIYRRGLITKFQNDIIIDMGDVETGTAPLPSGF